MITAPSSVYHMRLTRQVCGRMRLLRQIAIFTGCPKRQKVIRAAVIVQFRMLFDSQGRVSQRITLHAMFYELLGVFDNGPTICALSSSQRSTHL